MIKEQMSMAKYIRELSLVAASLFVAALLPSCISEQPSNTNAGGVTFAAAIGKDVKVNTRAGITFNPVQSDYMGIPFYINAEVNTAGDKKNELAKYQVASGMLGRLAAMDGEDEILWYNKKDTHIFYAWTMPWQDDEEFLNKNPEAQSKISFLPSTYEDMESLSGEDRINCGVMERFVATKTQPLTYNINGELVEMYFQHLVSKIRINATRLLIGEWPNNRDEVEAYMTFLDMPQEGIFYRHPEDGRAPYVEKSGDAKGVTCWIGGKTTTLYVCPEVDFSNMRFAIHFNDGHGNRSDYNGDFRSVIFKRPDEDLGHWDDDKKTTVLYAGEEMTINLVIRNDDAPNFTVNINPWTDRYRDGISHAKQGIYTKTEVEDLYNKFAGGNYTPEDVQEVLDLFGVEENGEKIIYMYEDLEINHGHFPLDPAFILDGLGHVLQMRNTSRTFRSDGKKHEYCAQVPLCRNIFLTNGDGKHMIYIDDEYRIWKVNPDTLEMEDTGNKLPVPLPNGQKSYFIDYETGEVDTSSTV